MGIKKHYLPQTTMSKSQDSQCAISIQAPKACREFTGSDTHISTMESEKVSARIPLYQLIRTPKFEGTMDKKHM